MSMSSIARRMAVSSLCGVSSSSSSSSSSIVESSSSSSQSFSQNKRIERVKFGVPLNQLTHSSELPQALLMLILKLNKEAPNKKDVFRAPGHQANMKKLIHFIQNGRMVNIDSYSVYTIASVLKKFLRKIPGGIFGYENEMKLFNVIKLDDNELKRQQIHDIITSMNEISQKLLVLLFGTFKAIALSSSQGSTGMTSEALGVSVAPSLFQSCVQDGHKFAKMDDVHRFKAQIAIASSIIKFLIDNFGVTNLFGKNNYDFYVRISGRNEREQQWNATELNRHRFTAISHEDSRSSPNLNASQTLSLDELKTVNKYAESTKSLSFLPLVHERQTQRMNIRSQWFLQGVNDENHSNNCLVRRSSSKDKKSLVRKSSSQSKKRINEVQTNEQKYKPRI